MLYIIISIQFNYYFILILRMYFRTENSEQQSKCGAMVGVSSFSPHTQTAERSHAKKGIYKDTLQPTNLISTIYLLHPHHRFASKLIYWTTPIASKRILLNICETYCATLCEIKYEICK